MDSPTFVKRVAELSGVDKEIAERVVRATLLNLGTRIDPGEADDLAAQLPEAIGACLRHTWKAQRFPPSEFMRRVACVVPLGNEQGAHAVRAVFTVRDAPVLGVACGSLGALSAVSGEELLEALDRFGAGDWTVRSLPALAVRASGAPDDWAVNDFVVVRRGSGHIVAEVAVDGELYVRLAGDGLAVATPIGSSTYSMAAGGPLLAANTPAFVCTPVAMHGGSAPPLVVPAHASLTVEVQVDYAGFGVEIDGHRRSVEATSFRLTRQENKVKLVTFSPSGATLGTLRQRGLIADSPRVLARDARGQQAVGQGQP